ncbi:MAG: hypothetical protein DMG68_05590 [Acidobacteria bacterium]|nr:MAG: hypothetical protein DMG68_05590 [Acidobacteriota bacterium]
MFGFFSHTLLVAIGIAKYQALLLFERLFLPFQILQAVVSDSPARATPANPYSLFSWSVPFIPGFDATIIWTFSGSASTPFYRPFTLTRTQNIVCR